MSVEQTVIDKIFAELKADHDELSLKVIEGGATSYENYREMVGLMAGIRRATDTIRDGLKKFQQMDDEAFDVVS